MEKTSREKQFYVWEFVERQSRMKGVLIKVVWSKQNGEGKCAKSCRIASILSISWSEWSVCKFGNGITITLSGGNGVARYKQQWNGREHNS